MHNFIRNLRSNQFLYYRVKHTENLKCNSLVCKKTKVYQTENHLKKFEDVDDYKKYHKPDFG